MSTVPSLLRQCADTYEQRNKQYGNSYHDFGFVMTSLFPKGINAKSVSDFNRLGVLVMIVSKLTRYANQFSQGGHDDSLLDLSVYAQMLRELDALAAAGSGEKSDV